MKKIHGEAGAIHPEFKCALITNDIGGITLPVGGGFTLRRDGEYIMYALKSPIRLLEREEKGEGDGR